MPLYKHEEPMLGPDIPPLPCIYQDECEEGMEEGEELVCPCDYYKYREDKET